MRVLSCFTLLALLFVALLCGVAKGHPPVTFTMLLDLPNPDTTPGVLYNLTFYIYDQLNDFERVNITQLVPMHSRYVHVMLASEDLENVFHLHPDDYSTYDEMAKMDHYFVTMTFPKAGKWYMATSFLALIDGKLREGAAQIEFVVPGSPEPNTPQYGFQKEGKFRTYPIGSNQIFQLAVDSRSNRDEDGYRVQVEVEGGNMSNIASYTCQPFYITVWDPSGNPVTNFVPYLDAPLHMIFVADRDTIYHGHGMDLPSIASTLAGVQNIAKKMDDIFEEMDMDMGDMPMHMSHTEEEMNVAMNAFMMGFTNNGTMNCTADIGPEMQRYHMDPYTPMLPTHNYTFGPHFMGFFDFPNIGNWRLFIYLQLQRGNETVLIVPDFSFATVPSPNSPTDSPPASTTSPSPNHATPRDTSNLFIIGALLLFIYL